MSIHKDKNYRLSEKDSIFVNRMSIKDPAFLTYLDRQVGNKMLFTVQDKCSRLINQGFLDEKYKKLNAGRIKIVAGLFTSENVRQQVKIMAGKSTVPYNGFSYFKIVYKGELPEFLKNAYTEMNTLNDESPRKRYRKERKGIRERLKS